MLILAIETTADLCSIAVRDERGTRVARAFRHRMHLSERLIANVEALLADAEVSLKAVEGFGVGIGPGSFTGVRVGVMTVKTWAHVLNRPVCGIGALDALAAEYPGVTDIVAPLIRARPGSVYSRFYDMNDGAVTAIGDVEMATLPELTARLAAKPNARYLFCGEALQTYRDELEAACRQAGVAAAFGASDPPRAARIAALTEARLAAGMSDDPLTLAPLYVAPPPIGPRVVQPSTE